MADSFLKWYLKRLWKGKPTKEGQKEIISTGTCSTRKLIDEKFVCTPVDNHLSLPKIVDPNLSFWNPVTGPKDDECPLCCYCVHFQPEWNCVTRTTMYFCTNTRRHCEIERTSAGDFCGLQGKYFEDKRKVFTTAGVWSCSLSEDSGVFKIR